jgi:ribosomal protein S18 acetylase RimI-like enzyme
MVDPCVGYIKNIYVASRLRGQGYGKVLLRFAEQWCAGHGVNRISLDASCCNEHAVSLYRRAGYEATRLRMEKDIDVGSQSLAAAHDVDRTVN